MLLPILTSAFVGGLIGYSTNWLAIRMLFRPLTEKYIGPYHVPFTPGLIPKKRAALAKSLGDTVADYLVTTDTLAAAFEHPAFTHDLEQFLGEAWTRLTSNEQSVQQLLQAVGLESRIEALPEQLTAQLLSLLTDDAWLAELLDKLKLAIGQDWHKPQANNQQGTVSDLLTEGIALILTSKQVQARFLAQLQQFIDSLKSDETALLADVLPLTLQEKVHNLILAEAPSWLDWLYAKLQTPASRALVKSLVQQFLGGSTLLKLVAAFADTGKIADSLTQALAKEEVRTQITTLLLRGWEQLLAQPLSKLTSKLAVEQLNKQDGWLVELALQLNSRSAIKEILLHSIELEDGYLAGDPELTYRLDNLGQRALKQLLQAPATRQTLSSLLRSLLARLLQATPRALLANMEPISFGVLATKLGGWLLQATSAYGPKVLQALRLPEVVEAQVNALDIVQVEEILLQVMREQLSAITNLGFLLGALIGTITPFLSQLLERG